MRTNDTEIRGRCKCGKMVLAVILTRNATALIHLEDWARNCETETRDGETICGCPADFCWHAHVSKRGFIYAASSISRPRKILLRMHRLIMNAPANLVVDHIQGDTTDNRKHCSIELVTYRQNNVRRFATKTERERESTH